MEKRLHIVLPCRLVEISGEKPTCFVGQQRVDACCEFASQMVVNNLVEVPVGVTLSTVAGEPVPMYALPWLSEATAQM